MERTPTSRITTDYLMTAHFPVDPGHGVDDTFMIWCVCAGGWVEGPRITGEIIAPSGDWGRFLPDGTLKLDVRATIRTDDGAIVFMAFGGRFRGEETIEKRLLESQTIGPDEARFIVAPTFETGAARYAWLNQVVAVGKMVSLKGEPEGHVRFDIFALG